MILSEFQLKRIDYFIRTAKSCQWAHLGPADIEIFENLKMNNFSEVSNHFNKGYDMGYKDGTNDTLQGVDKEFEKFLEESCKEKINE